ncbi:MAG: mechanosensitive ion channel [Caldilineaceae bacterium]|nr:mechanosensitive ion channel [Caldilineaceae bacterium]
MDIFRDPSEIQWWEIGAALALGWLIVSATQWLVPRVARQLPNRFRLRLLPIAPIVRMIVLLVVVTFVVLALIEPTAPNLITALSAVGVALGFAFKDYVSSIIAGIVALYERPYQPGDWVKIGSDYGMITSMGLRSIKIQTPDDNTVTIPHAKMWNENISNANAGNREHMTVAEFFLEPDHDADLVRQTLWNVGISSPYTQYERAVVVIVLEKPWGTQYRLKAYPIDGRDEFLYLSDLTVRGKAALKELGVKQVAMPIPPSMGAE